MSGQRELGEEPSLAPLPSFGAMLCAVGTFGSGPPAYNRRPECAPISEAPVEEKDIEPLVAMALSCPVADLSTRIFQQHSEMQTCWHDAFFMLAFHANPLKEGLERYLRLFLRTLFELGYKDLSYAEPDPGGERHKNLPPYVKPSAIAKVFKEKYPEHPLQFWELYCLALQRFLLLNYLFLKDAESRSKRSLFQRRKSISEAEFTMVHKDFKAAALFVKSPGLWCYDVSKLKTSVAKFISKSSGGTYEMLPITTAPDTLRDIQGYYIWQEMTHVFSLFCCGDLWYVYDNEVGSAPFSKAESEKLSKVAIVSMEVGDSKAHPGKVEYKFKLADDTEVATLVVKMAESEEKTIPIDYGLINPTSSFVLARRITDGGARPYMPTKYFKGLSKTKRAKRAKEIRKFGALHWKDPRAYKGFSTNRTVKTKSSGYTQSWNKLFPDAKSLEERAKVTGVPVKYLRESYNRGMAAWRTGHRPGATQQQWGYARVSSFLLCGKTHFTTDSDLVREAKGASAAAKAWWRKRGC